MKLFVEPFGVIWVYLLAPVLLPFLLLSGTVKTTSLSRD